MTIENCRDYRRADPNVRKAVDESIIKLRNRYSEYQKQNIVITNVFGDDIIIHDIIDKDFYVYKSQSNRMQIRLLYKVLTDGTIDVINFYVKNSNSVPSQKGSRRSKRYIPLFETYVKEYKKKGTLPS